MQDLAFLRRLKGVRTKICDRLGLSDRDVHIAVILTGRLAKKDILWYTISSTRGHDTVRGSDLDDVADEFCRRKGWQRSQDKMQELLLVPTPRKDNGHAQT